MELPFKRAAPPEEATHLDESTREALRAHVDNDDKKPTIYDLLKCVHCGGLHAHACPRVRRMSFTDKPGVGQVITEVEFWPDGRWSDSGIVWPWDVFTDGPPVAAVSSEPSTEGGST